MFLFYTNLEVYTIIGTVSISSSALPLQPVLHAAERATDFQDTGCNRACADDSTVPQSPAWDSGGAYRGLTLVLLPCAAADDCAVGVTGMPAIRGCRQIVLSRNRCTISLCCISGWLGLRHIFPHTASGSSEISYLVLYCS